MRLGLLSLAALSTMAAAWIGLGSPRTPSRGASLGVPPPSVAASDVRTREEPMDPVLSPIPQPDASPRLSLLEGHLEEQFTPLDVDEFQAAGVTDLSGFLPRTAKFDRGNEPIELRFRALDSSGYPMARAVVGISVDLYDASEGELTSRPPAASSPAPRKREGAVRKADPEGRVSIILRRKCFPDSISVVRVRDEHDLVAALRSIVVPEGDVIDMGDVRLLSPRERFPAALAAGSVLDSAGRSIEALEGRVHVPYVQDFDVEIASYAAIADPVFHWRNPADFQVVIGSHGGFRVYGPDPGADPGPGPDLGGDGPASVLLMLEFRASGFQPGLLEGLTVGASGLQVRLARATQPAR